MRRAPYKSPTQIGCLFSSGRMTLCNNNHPLEQFSLWHSMEYYAVMGFVHEFVCVCTCTHVCSLDWEKEFYSVFIR